MTGEPRYLLLSDLDRTLLPNGTAPESPAARPLLRRIAERPELTLAYISGRNQALLQEAIEEYALPEPDYAVGDVGTTVYALSDGIWHPSRRWHETLAADWGDRDGPGVLALLEDIPQCRPQAAADQGRFKASFYCAADADPAALAAAVEARLSPHSIRAHSIFSVDEVTGQGLLDVLPESADKLHAARFLMDILEIPETQTVFAGDSGNDLPVLASAIPAVLVRNAPEPVRTQALEQARRAGHGDRLYIARGEFMGMNGCYAAGVLEGLAHYLPEARAWLEAART